MCPDSARALRSRAGSQRVASRRPLPRHSDVRKARPRGRPALEAHARLLRGASVQRRLDRSRESASADGCAHPRASRRRARRARPTTLRRRDARAAPRGSIEGFPHRAGIRSEGGGRPRRVADVPLYEVRIRPRRRPFGSLPRRHQLEDQAGEIRSQVTSLGRARRQPHPGKSRRSHAARA